MIPEHHRRQLEESSFVLLEHFMSPDLLEEVRQQLDSVYAAEGDKAGSEFRQETETRRLANLVEKGEVFRRLITTPQILDYVATVIPGEFKLSSLNARAPNPQSEWVQPLHCDTGALPDAKGNTICNVIWMLDDFTSENGATRLVPGSHKWGHLPQEVMPDPMAPHPQEILLLASAGSVAIVNTHAWHGGTANRSGGSRRCIHAFYTRWDKPQQQFQDGMLSERTKAQLSPELRKLLAIGDEYNAKISLADPLRSGFLK